MKRRSKAKDTTEITEARIVQRVSTGLPSVVQMKDSDGEGWREMTDITTISRNGAGFSLARPCEIGRLVRLVIPMPRELRAYDRSEELYPVMGVVQNCNKEQSDEEDRYHVGVALIGKNAPASYLDNPLQSYRIRGMGEDGLWTVTEAQTPHKKRRHPRYGAQLEVTVTLLQKDKRKVTKETAITRNIGLSGASVVCSLDAKPGDIVKFACKSLNFYAMARVRNRRQIADRTPTLHLEFVESTFPVEKISTEGLPANETRDKDVSHDPGSSAGPDASNDMEAGDPDVEHLRTLLDDIAE